MSHPLAVYVPHLGIRSETFIRRHIWDLVPRRAVVIADRMNAEDSDWGPPGPVCIPRQMRGGWWERLSRGVMRRLGSDKDSEEVAVTRFLQANGVDVFLGEYLDRSLRWLPVVKRMGIRFWAHAHGYDVSIRLCQSRWREQYLRYNEADGVITMSEASRDRLIELGLDKRKIYVVPYGVDVPERPRRAHEGPIVRCLAVGRMVSKKAPILMLDAFRRAASSCRNLHLEYVGDGPLRSAAEDFARALDFEGRVTFHGDQPNASVHRLMSKCDIFIQHSVVDPVRGDEEGMPVAILEAMAHSLPVVSTRHAGIPEAVLDGLTGYLVEEGDSNGMGECILELAQNDDLRQGMGHSGWKRARKLFTWERERKALLRLLDLAHWS